MWDKLSIKDKARIMKMAVESGLTDLNKIKEIYNKQYENGGDLNPYSAGELANSLYENAEKVTNLGIPSHNYDFVYSEEWADANGYYPDERGHRDDRVKKASHPTHPSKGQWNGLNEFKLTDLGMEDPNYIMFGMADGNQDPQAIITYNGNIVLPELTITPKKRYIHNSYDNLNIELAEGGDLGIGKIVNKFDGDSESTGFIDKAKSQLKGIYYSIIGTNTYNTPTLKEAIFQAYSNGDKGKVIKWNDNYYKASLNDSDEKEYKNRDSYIAIDEAFSKYPSSPYESWEESKKWAEENGYIDYMSSQARRIQHDRVRKAKSYDYEDSGRKYLSLKDTYNKKYEKSQYNISSINYPPDLIDAIAENLPEGMDIWKALTLPIHETHIGQGSEGTNLPTKEGVVRAFINNHDYELNLGYFSDIAQHLRNVVRSVYPKGSAETDKDYSSRIEGYIKETHNLDTFKINHPKLYAKMNEDAKRKFNKRRWEQNNKEIEFNEPYLKHALTKYEKGTYNNGDLNYNKETEIFTRELKKSKTLREYLKSKGYIK